jgi:glutamine amidotransferase
VITIVDSGIANVRSVQNMFRKAGVAARITQDPADVRGAEKLVLPGVGSFDAAMRALRQHGLDVALTETVQQKRTPILGICLGMQLFARRSEEGVEPGLGWVDADVVRFKFPNGERKVPHMGWNELTVARPSRLLDQLPAESRFYFVHSFHITSASPQLVAATTTYGYDFVAAVEQDNVMGVQFHPEKSHRFGMALLQRFAAL